MTQARLPITGSGSEVLNSMPAIYQHTDWYSFLLCVSGSSFSVSSSYTPRWTLETERG